MASRKMTFAIPDDLATELMRRIPPRERSGYVAKALAEKLHERERQLITACEIANREADVSELENDFDAVSDPISEPWTDAPAR